jgi:hypothetical protein
MTATVLKHGYYNDSSSSRHVLRTFSERSQNLQVRCAVTALLYPHYVAQCVVCAIFGELHVTGGDVACQVADPSPAEI